MLSSWLNRRRSSCSAIGSSPSESFQNLILAHRAWLDQRLRRRLDLLTAKSSNFALAFNFSRSHMGCAPRPAHVFPALSLNLIGALRPLSGLPPLPSLRTVWRLSLERSFRNCAALRVRTRSTSDRSCSNCSTFIALRLDGLGIGVS